MFRLIWLIRLLGCWAYSSLVARHPERCYQLANQKVTCLSCEIDGKIVFLKDTRLPFGTQASPFIFNTITQAIRFMMCKRHHNDVVIYLDDFCVCDELMPKCLEIVNVFIALLRKLGFQINWNKVEEPSQNLIFFGYQY